jgi:hypothetical protein
MLVTQEELMDLKGGMRFKTFHKSQDLWGRSLRPSPREEVLGHLLMETEMHLELLQ